MTPVQVQTAKKYCKAYDIAIFRPKFVLPLFSLKNLWRHPWQNGETSSKLILLSPSRWHHKLTKNLCCYTSRLSKIKRLCSYDSTAHFQRSTATTTNNHVKNCTQNQSNMENHTEEQIESECSFKFHEFVIDIGTTLACHTIKMDNCLYLWVGDPKKQTMNDLSFAIVSPYGKEPLTTKIMGPISDETSSNFAKRLSKKLSKPVYVSFNVEVDTPSMRALERKLKDELSAHPEAF